jgi:hypothetical protein
MCITTTAWRMPTETTGCRGGLAPSGTAQARRAAGTVPRGLRSGERSAAVQLNGDASLTQPSAVHGFRVYERRASRCLHGGSELRWASRRAVSTAAGAAMGFASRCLHGGCELQWPSRIALSPRRRELRWASRRTVSPAALSRDGLRVALSPRGCEVQWPSRVALPHGGCELRWPRIAVPRRRCELRRPHAALSHGTASWVLRTSNAGRRSSVDVPGPRPTWGATRKFKAERRRPMKH